jgi:hypothetical protein
MYGETENWSAYIPTAMIFSSTNFLPLNVVFAYEE